MWLGALCLLAVFGICLGAVPPPASFLPALYQQADRMNQLANRRQTDDDDAIDRREYDEDLINTAVDWATKHGALYNVVFKKDADGDMRMFAKEDTGSGDVLVKLPPSFMLTSANVATDCPYCDMQGFGDMAPLGADNVLMKWLTYHAYLRTDSAWVHCLVALPKNYTWIPTYWPESKLTYLGESSIDATVSLSHRFARKTLVMTARLENAVIKHNEGSKTWREYVDYLLNWAHAVVMSESIQTHLGKILPMCSPQNLGRPMWLDSSHSLGAKVRIDPNGYYLVSQKSYKKGEEIFLEQPPQTNLELSFKGKIYANNPHDRISISIPVSSYMKSKDYALAFWDEFALTRTLLGAHLGNVEMVSGKRPDVLIWIFRLLMAKVEDVDSIGRSMYYGEPISILNEFEAITEAGAYLKSKAENMFWLRGKNLSGKRKLFGQKYQQAKYNSFMQVRKELIKHWNEYLFAPSITFINEGQPSFKPNQFGVNNIVFDKTKLQQKGSKVTDHYEDAVSNPYGILPVPRFINPLNKTNNIDKKSGTLKKLLSLYALSDSSKQSKGNDNSTMGSLFSHDGVVRSLGRTNLFETSLTREPKKVALKPMQFRFQDLDRLHAPRGANIFNLSKSEEDWKRAITMVNVQKFDWNALHYPTLDAKITF